MLPDGEALFRDIAAPSFAVAVRRGKWAFKGFKHPYALFFIAAPPRTSGPPGFLLRSDCTSYSGIAPTSQLWHGGRNAPLEVAHRPHIASGVMLAFQDWQQCLYHPIDRLAATHNNWTRDFPEKLWTPDKDITFLLETVHDLLNDSEYVGAALPVEALTVPTEFVEEYRSRAA